MQVEALLACAIEQFGAGRFAILYPNETYGESFMELFRDRAEYYGADVVGTASYAPDQTDFSSPIKRLAKISEARDEQVSAPHRLSVNGKDGPKTAGVALDFDAIFIPDEHSKAALIAPQLAYWDVNHVLLMGTNLWHSDRLIEIARDYVQNAILADVYYAQSANKTVQNFIRSFEELYGEPPGPIEGLAYDTAMIAFQTSANPDVRSRIGIKDRLKEIYNFDGATGLTSFKVNGDAQKRLYLLQISGVDFVELKQR
jgi:ABC-type branched-subunit amino acid transport system substrate-binding protein